SGITEEMRINMKGRIFDIIEPPMNVDEMYQTLSIIGKEYV
ncbi:head-tail adaptor protein, partial [Bacillus thuringiensis]|nr:head-tail adaptor protein [Bacillus thuringiensis]